MFLTFNLKELSIPECQGLMQGLVAPRPVAFASTIDKQGNVNLSPFSFFNMFSTNPPVLVFSPSLKGRDGSPKHTLENVLEVPEVVINVVTYDMVEQASLASVEYDKGVNEFIKAGFSSVASEMVKPPRVYESPASFECKVTQVIPLGTGPAAGNLVVAEVLLIHVNPLILDESGLKINPKKADLIARMGGDYYCRANGDNIFVVPKPNQKKGIGIDQIPDHIRNSTILTGNNLGRLGNIEKMPDKEEVEDFKSHPLMQEFVTGDQNNPADFKANQHRIAKELLEKGMIKEAWLVLLSEL
jgi:flavin reductase (DIM6/NTAB) family NADH-FMN oxidoreductase RutF